MTASFIGLALLLIVAFMGFPLGFTMMSVGFIGFGLIRGWGPGLEMTGQQILSIAMNFGFSVLPLFVLMGVFVARAGLADDLYEAANAWLGHLRGGLAIATVAACGGFAAVSGSSAATAATMSKVAIPSMRRYGYADSLATGTVAAGGTMGILIPPSAALVIYGILTLSDIAALFIGAIIPGVLTVLLYIAVIMIVVRIFPEIGPRGRRSTWTDRFRSLSKVWGVVVLFLLILGGIFFGVFTPTEAGGIGSVGALFFALGRRKMRWAQFTQALMEAARTTTIIFSVAFGALILNQFLNIAGLPNAMVAFITGLNVTPLAAFFVILAIYVLLGMFIDGFSMIFLTVPIFVPVVQALGFDIIWFGVILVMAVEVALITPPIGMNVFILKSMLPDVPLGTIYRGIGPFFIADLVRLALVVFFPTLVLYLPRIME